MNREGALSDVLGSAFFLLPQAVQSENRCEAVHGSSMHRLSVPGLPPFKEMWQLALVHKVVLFAALPVAMRTLAARASTARGGLCLEICVRGSCIPQVWLQPYHKSRTLADSWSLPEPCHVLCSVPIEVLPAHFGSLAGVGIRGRFEESASSAHVHE